MRKPLAIVTFLLCTTVLATTPAHAELVGWAETDGSIFAVQYGEIFALHMNLGARSDAKRTMLPAKDSWRSQFKQQFKVRRLTVRGTYCSVRFELKNKASGNKALSRVFLYDCSSERPRFRGGYAHPSGEHLLIRVRGRYHHVKAPR